MLEMVLEKHQRACELLEEERRKRREVERGIKERDSHIKEIHEGYQAKLGLLSQQVERGRQAIKKEKEERKARDDQLIQTIKTKEETIHLLNQTCNAKTQEMEKLKRRIRDLEKEVGRERMRGEQTSSELIISSQSLKK